LSGTHSTSWPPGAHLQEIKKDAEWNLSLAMSIEVKNEWSSACRPLLFSLDDCFGSAAYEQGRGTAARIKY
jgi:hypothetical protein